MKAYEKVDLLFRSFLTSAINGGGEYEVLVVYYRRKCPWYLFKRRLGGSRKDLDALEQRKISYPFRRGRINNIPRKFK
jgi:hypothetical protein